LDKSASGTVDYYVGDMEIGAELRYALKIMKQYGWRCIDASYMAVEEVAVQVLQSVGE
jgi:regulator of PEP synthase PpsR (kinase-PPPase family)